MSRLLAAVMVVLVPGASDAARNLPPLYPLIEASGVEPFSPTGWQAAVTGGGLCGPGRSGMLLASSGNRAVLAAGPTPHAVGEDSRDLLPRGGSPWRAGAADGSRAYLFSRAMASAWPPARLSHSPSFTRSPLSPLYIFHSESLRKYAGWCVDVSDFTAHG